ncbi:hypothetical protein SERLADRAFT_416571 [Serpula lacrymans var. lacrymans S7.9]|uniref:Uncharacterized protein n=1 Tax=Serpula lacrymans var. lacrymans (strain S7.9) TaxID=578457 RepID=F8P1T1_SERL9|nr:uncharacterized protein SERLADRAFT_416571 [Serpula lacrymans var. lacrymans S7.9]EGO23109.1 hypothetical protein SERLADRAFT_416571 [Serpula lacrymans var. lacrymans S7.9]
MGAASYLKMLSPLIIKNLVSAMRKKKKFNPFFLDQIGSRQSRQRPQVYKGAWSPWQDRLSCTLDIVANLPRSDFSDKDIEVLLWLLQINGVSNVPSVGQMKALSRYLNDVCNVKMQRYMGAFGHAYYTVKLHSLVSMDLANPLIREHLEFYPEDAGTRLYESRQASAWLHHANPHRLTPMHRKGLTDYYTFEPTLLKDGTVCMPHRWYKKSSIMWFSAWCMVSEARANQTGWISNQGDQIDLSEVELSIYGKDLISSLYLGSAYPSFNNIHGYRRSCDGPIEEWPLSLLNPWRAKAKGSRVVSYPVWLYCDDTSGNRSKNAPPLEMLDGVIREFEECQEAGIWAYDCILHEVVLVLVFILALLGDNPMQSEFACHAGLRSRFFCRCCWASGNASGHQELTGFVSWVKSFIMTNKLLDWTLKKPFRNASITLNYLGKHCKGFHRPEIKEFAHQQAKKKLRGSNTDDATQQILSQMPTNPYNPIWHVKGYSKYFWQDAISWLSDSEKEILKARLSSIDVSGLDPSVTMLQGHTLVQYTGSLPEIDNLEAYLHIREYGPAITFATEGFKLFNSVIWGWCINSNHQALSHDSAQCAISLARLRHLVCGGYFEAEIEASNGRMSTKWISAGELAGSIFKTSPVVAHHLGLNTKQSAPQGLCTLSKEPPCIWQKMQALVKFRSPFGPMYYQKCATVVIQNGNVIKVGHHAAYKDENNIHHVCQVIKMLVRQDKMMDQHAKVVFLQRLDVGDVVLPYQMLSVKMIYLVGSTYSITVPPIDAQFPLLDQNTEREREAA